MGNSKASVSRDSPVSEFESFSHTVDSAHTGKRSKLRDEQGAHKVDSRDAKRRTKVSGEGELDSRAELLSYAPIPSR